MIKAKSVVDVIIVDDDTGICDSLECLFDSVSLKSAAYTDPSIFLSQANLEYDLKKTCLILDIRMPKYSGFEVHTKLIEQGFNIPVIFLTSHEDIDIVIKTMKQGAHDFLLKPTNEQFLLDSVHKAIFKSKTQNEKLEKTNEICTSIKSLTKREINIINLISTGKTNKVIAYDLNISIKTVELHRANVMKKMQSTSLAELLEKWFYYKNTNFYQNDLKESS
jgi:FixJ family two-component response regulator